MCVGIIPEEEVELRLGSSGLYVSDFVSGSGVRQGKDNKNLLHHERSHAHLVGNVCLQV